MSPSVTAAVITRNRPATLAQTLAAVLGQEDVDLEVIVVDEGSTDATPELLGRVRDERLRVVRNDPPLRLSGARNRALEAASGEWIAYTDDDDLWSPTHLTSLLEAATARGAEWAASGSVLVDPDLDVIDHQPSPPSGDVVDALLAANVVPGGGSGVLVRTGLARDLAGFDPALRGAEDWDFWIRCALASPLAVVDRPLVAYRIWPGSMSLDTALMVDAIRTVQSRYAAERARRHVAVDDAFLDRYLLKLDIRRGDRWAAARRGTALALRHRRFDDLPTAALSLLNPGFVDRAGQRRAAERVPATWRREAETWLAAIATAPAPWEESR